jgi:T5orf172 domain
VSDIEDDRPEADLEVTDYDRRGHECFWLVNDGERPCAQPAHYDVGSTLTFCHVHYKKFVSAVIAAVGDSLTFRDKLMQAVADYDEDEIQVWVKHRRKIRPLKSGPWRAHSVYFAERDGFVKIGRTANIAKRMHDIGKGSCMPQGMSVGPVRLLAVIYCDCTERSCVREKYFHQKFIDQHLEGEWFLFDLDIASFIGGLPDCLDDRLRHVSAARDVNAA